MREIFLGARQRRKMPKVVERAIHGDASRHVGFEKFESRVGPQVFDVPSGACDQIVESHDTVAVADQAIAQVGADESGGSGNQMSQ